MNFEDIPVINDRPAFAQNVPTLDEDVRSALRRLGEPDTFPGEDKPTRRQRLIDLMTERNLQGFEQDDIDVDSESDSESESEFYTPGPQQLYEVRVRLVEYSTSKAAARLRQNRQNIEHDFIKVLKHRRNINRRLGKLELYGSQVIPGSSRTLSAVRYNHDSTQIGVASWDGNVYMVDSEKLEKTTQLARLHTEKAVLGMHSTENMVVSGGNEGTIGVWNANTTGTMELATSFPAHDSRITSVAWHGSGEYVVSTSFDQTWKFWDVNTKQCLLEQEGHSKEVFTSSLHPDGGLLATGGLDAIARVWDLRSGRSIAVLQNHIKGIYCMDWSDNGYHLATGSGDCSVKIWDLRKQDELFSIPAHKKLVSDVRFFHKKSGALEEEVTGESGEDPVKLDSNGTFLATSSYDNTVCVWSADNWIKVNTLQGHTDKVMSCDISGDGLTVVSSGWDRSVKVWRE